MALICAWCFFCHVPTLIVFFFTSVYLLFDPDSEIDILKKHVFNTEAHPVKIFDS